MSDTVIRVENLSKRYRIGSSQEHFKYGSLRDSLANAVKAPFRRLRSSSDSANKDPGYIWALKDVSFEVKQGDVLGIIGRNGAGKTTLLKILSRITKPTEGQVRLRGRVGSLLEVGTGFHPELTGRENIYLNGAVLGMKRVEIDQKFDEIVDFAEIEDFLDTPVKHYSSGMYMRLAFAVAAHLEPEILLVDEVLAVGDAQFQKKCLRKMGEVAQEGRTVLFVSHNVGAIRVLCKRCLWISKGFILIDNEADFVVEEYISHMTKINVSKSEVSWDLGEAPGGDELKLNKVNLVSEDGICKSTFSNDEAINVHIYHQLLKDLPGIRVVLQIQRSAGEIAFTSTDHYLRDIEEAKTGKYRSICKIPGGLMNLGQYMITIWIGIPGVRYLLKPIEVIHFSIIGTGNQGSFYGDYGNWPGVICPKLEWSIIEEKEI